MANYDYLSISKQSIPVDLVGNIVEMALITERIESWKIFYPEALSILEKEATIDSVYYSNAIELITDDRARVEALIDGAEPIDKQDLKIIGYYNARKYVYESFNHPFTVEYILNIHKILMSGFDENAGKIRCENRPHRGYGTMTAVSYYVDFSEVEDNLKAMCESVEATISAGSVDRMMLISSVITDFLSLSPFLNGNGRMYRLIIEYFMLRLKMNAIRYMSLDKELFTDIKRHVDAIHRASVKKEGGSRDYIPFMMNYLNDIYIIYRKLDSMFPQPSEGRLNKKQRIRRVVSKMEGSFSNHDVSERLPDVSSVMIQQELSKMSEEGLIMRSGTTKGTQYTIKSL